RTRLVLPAALQLWSGRVLPASCALEARRGAAARRATALLHAARDLSPWPERGAASTRARGTLGALPGRVRLRLPARTRQKPSPFVFVRTRMSWWFTVM